MMNISLQSTNLPNLHNMRSAKGFAMMHGRVTSMGEGNGGQGAMWWGRGVCGVGDGRRVGRRGMEEGKGSGGREREWEGKPDCETVIVWMRGI